MAVVVERRSSDGRDSALSSCALGVKLFGGIERVEVKDVNRGRMYEKVEDCGGGEGAVLGGPGGGNQRAMERRTQSEVTWRVRSRSALEPTM